MEEKAKKKLTVKGLLKALLVVLLILVILSLIIILGGKGNKKDNGRRGFQRNQYRSE